VEAIVKPIGPLELLGPRRPAEPDVQRSGNPRFPLSEILVWESPRIGPDADTTLGEPRGGATPIHHIRHMT